MKVGDLVIHREWAYWGCGLIVGDGPVYPVSGKQMQVLWPNIPDAQVDCDLNFYPILKLEKLSDKGNLSEKWLSCFAILECFSL